MMANDPADERPSIGLESSLLLPRIQRAFWGGLAALAAVAVTTVAMHAYAVASRNSVLRYREVLHVARDARSLAIVRETEIRAFLLSRDTTMLAFEREAAPTLAAQVDSLVQLSDGDTAQRRASLEVRNTLDAWQSAYAGPLFDAAVHGAGAMPDRGAGDALFVPFRASLEALIDSDEARFDASVRRQSVIDTFGILAVVGELLVLAIALLVLRRRTLDQTGRMVEQQRTLRRQALELELRATELERQVDRTRAMADYLQSVNVELRETVAELSRTRAEKQSAVREHEESRATLDVVLAGASVGIALVDRDLRFERVNETFGGFDGVDVDAHTDRAMGEVAPHLAASLAPAIARVLDTERPELGIEVEGAVRDDPADPRHWMVNVYPVRGPEGKVRGAGVVAVETTERKHLERQLMQAQKMEAVGRLAGSIAHDFNNLLTAISAFAQFAGEEVGEDSEVHEDLGQILLATERGSALTRRLLAFSRQQVVQPRAVDLNKVVEDLDDMLRRLLGADVTLETTLAPDLWRIDADTGQLEQVILNLAINARDAMPDGGTIALRTSMEELDETFASYHGEPAAGPHVVLTLSDTGAGMDAATQARAFEPFFTTKPVGKGTGLGLSTVYGIVRQFKGSIALHSEAGRGTTFRVVFPRSEEAARVETEEEAVPGPSRLAPVSVLLVEDDAPVRYAVHRALQRSGCTVHEAPNGRDALDLLKRVGGWVDLVITDLVMPEMGGLEFAREVRGKSPTTRILFISGYSADARLRRTLAESGAAYLEKPFTADGLVAKVREVLGNGGSAGGVAA